MQKQPEIATGKELKQLLDKLSTRIREDGLKSLVPLMFLLSIKGKPYNLDKHFMFEPVFDLQRPREFLLKCARQVGKSQNMMGNNTLQSILIPYLKTLIVAPLFSQAKRLNDDGVKPLTADTPFRNCFDSAKCYHGSLRHTWKSNAQQLFSYAFTSCDRIRGIADIANCIIDEVQDMDPSFIPIIGETMSATDDSRGFFTYAGTPLTLDNNIQMLWERSSQGEWVIPCKACNKENYSTVKMDLLKMIGPDGLICAKCGKAIDSVNGFFEHAVPSYLSTFEAYHIPQVIHPIHYRSKNKWSEILRKQKNYSQAQFWNEVLGESCDSAAMPISHSELMAVCSDDDKFNNTIPSACARAAVAYNLVMGIDWGGGGADAQSTTVVVVGRSIPNTDRIEVVYMERFPTSWTPGEETARVLTLVRSLKPHVIAHDYGGGGNLRETMLVTAGVNPSCMAPFTYDFAPRHNIIRLHSAGQGSRRCCLIDKTRSLKVLFGSIKAGKVTFPHKDKCWDVLKDFLNVGEERTETPRKSDIILIHRKAGRTDDALHAVNFMFSYICFAQNTYPQLTGLIQSPATSDLDEVEPAEPSW